MLCSAGTSPVTVIVHWDSGVNLLPVEQVQLGGGHEIWCWATPLFYSVSQVTKCRVPVSVFTWMFLVLLPVLFILNYFAVVPGPPEKQGTSQGWERWPVGRKDNLLGEVSPMGPVSAVPTLYSLLPQGLDPWGILPWRQVSGEGSLEKALHQGILFLKSATVGVPIIAKGTTRHYYLVHSKLWTFSQYKCINEINATKGNHTSHHTLSYVFGILGLTGYLTKWLNIPCNCSKITLSPPFEGIWKSMEKSKLMF